MLLGPCDLTSLIKNGKINSNNKKAGGLLIPEGIMRTVVSVSGLTWSIIYIIFVLTFTVPKSCNDY